MLELIEKLYLKLKDETIVKFTVMLQEIQDFNFKNCVRNRVLDIHKENGNIIFNKKSEISMSIRNYEDSLMKITKEYFPKAVNILKEYKIGNKKEKDLLELFNDFEKMFTIKVVMDEIDSYVNQCQKELEGIQFAASKNNINDYVLFSDVTTLDTWFLDYWKPKVLLKTDASQSKECNIYFNNEPPIVISLSFY